MKALLVTLPLLLGGGLALAPPPDDPLRAAYLISSQRPNCLQGQWLLDAGNPAAARAVFEQCVARWNDLYSLVQLARLDQHSNPAQAAQWLASAAAIDPQQTDYWQQRLTSPTSPKEH